MARVQWRFFSSHFDVLVLQECVCVGWGGVDTAKIVVVCFVFCVCGQLYELHLLVSLSTDANGMPRSYSFYGHIGPRKEVGVTFIIVQPITRPLL